MSGRQVIFYRQFAVSVVLILLGTIYSAGARGGEALDKAQDLLDQVAQPLFAAAGVEPELRFEIAVVEGNRPVASMLGRDRAEISVAVFLLADTPEELAAAVARVIGEKEIQQPSLGSRKGYKFRPRLPNRDRLRGSVTSVDEAIAQSGIRAAEDTLKRQGGYGPATEEIRAHARNLDNHAVSLLRKAGLHGTALIHLYEAMAAQGAGLFERDDYEGRQILHEQIEWLRERVESNDNYARSPQWMVLDTKLDAVQAAFLKE